MSEYTKSRLRTLIESEKCPVIIDGDNEAIICQMVADDPMDEANARELVRRWNAFEDGGAVKGLLDACKELLPLAEKAPGCSSPDCTICPKNKATKTKAKAAIAAAEKEG